MKRLRLAFAAGMFLACLAVAALTGCGGSNVTINIELQPSGSQTVDEGGVINFTALVGGDTSGQGVSWKLTGTSCAGTPASGCGTLSNETNSSVTYTAPSGISAGITATLTATSLVRKSVTQTSSISVVLAPTFSQPCASTPATCPLSGGANGVPYSQAITITGGVTPYAYSVVNGSLPSCLSLNGLANGLTNTIVGTPCGSGTSTFTIQVVDNQNPLATSHATIQQVYSITIQPPPKLSIATTSLPQGFTNVQYNAALTANGGVPPLTWHLMGGGNTVAPGLTLDPTTGRISGVPTSTGTFPFQVTVSDSSLPAPGQSAGPQTISITIQSPPNLSISTLFLTGGTVASGYQATLQATGGIAPYTWTLTQGQLPAGLTLTTANNSTGVISGVPNLAGTSAFAVQVTDSEFAPVTKTASFSIVITPGTAGGNSLLSGAYTFLFRGFDSGGPMAIIGTITADGNGNITSGSEDINRYSATAKQIQISNNLPVSGTYSIGTDGRGTLELVAVNGENVSLTTDYRLVLDSSGTVHFFENNATGTNNDTLGTYGEAVMKPSPNAGNGAFSGNYAFEFAGVDANAKREALGGVLHSDGAGNITTGGVGPNSDLNDAGTFTSQNLSGGFSLVGSGSSRGGVSFLLQPTGQPQTTLTFVLYFVSSSDLFLMESDSSTTTFPHPPRLSGEMILQDPSTTFSQAVLGGTSVVTGTGVNGGNTSVFGGLLTSTLCDGNAPASLSADENNAGTVSTGESFTGSCTVTANGRVSFSLASGANPARISTAYLTGPGTGFLMGNDAAVTTGFVEQQSGGPFANSSLVDGYTLGAPFPEATGVYDVIGQVAADGLGGINGAGSIVDAAQPPGKPVFLGQSFNATINALSAAGRSLVTTNAPTGMPTNLILYVVSPSSFRAINTDSGNTVPQVFFFDH
ncbi:MAG TPA: Ig domain-containing protein [Candidatus Aquilonibacter sp.]|nr:Ig domain-containing protein [Candidatus Aquilonibacter sp.]